PLSPPPPLPTFPRAPSLHDALPIFHRAHGDAAAGECPVGTQRLLDPLADLGVGVFHQPRAGAADYLQDIANALHAVDVPDGVLRSESTRLNSSHVAISYAVFCLKKK